jgi:hypothetical protein
MYVADNFGQIKQAKYYDAALSTLIHSSTPVLHHFLTLNRAYLNKNHLRKIVENTVKRKVVPKWEAEAALKADTATLTHVLTYAHRHFYNSYNEAWDLVINEAFRHASPELVNAILDTAPLPYNGSASLILSSAVNDDHHDLLTLKLNSNRLKFTVSNFTTALKVAFAYGKTACIKALLEKIKEDINTVGLFSIFKDAGGDHLRFHCSKTLQTNYPIFLKNIFITQQTLSKIAAFFPFPNDLEWRDFNIFSSSKITLDPNGQPLTVLDNSVKRIYICPTDKHLLEKILRTSAVGVFKIIEAIGMVAEHIFKLIKAIYEKDWNEMRPYAVAIVTLPLAVVGLEAALLLALISPWRGSKLYYACSMSIHNCAPSYFFENLYFDPSFLHRPVSKYFTDA